MERASESARQARGAWSSAGVSGAVAGLNPRGAWCVLRWPGRVDCTAVHVLGMRGEA